MGYINKMATFIINTTDIITAREVFTNFFGRPANKIMIKGDKIKIIYYHKDQYMIDFIKNDMFIEYAEGKNWEVVSYSHKLERQDNYNFNSVRWDNVNRYIPSTWPTDLTEEERYIMEQEAKVLI